MGIRLSQPKIVFGCILLVVLFVYCSPWITQDGPNHQKVALILSRLSESPLENQVYASQVSLLHTNELFPALYTAFAKIIDIKAYEKTFVALFMAAFILSYWLFLKTWSPKSAVFWPLVLPLCFNPLIIRGFYNFLACLPLSLMALIFLKRAQEKFSLATWFSFSLFTWLAYLAHPFALLVLLPVTALLFFEGNKTSKLSLLPFFATALLFLGLGFLPSLFHSSQHETNLALRFSPAHETLAGLFVWNVSAFHWVAFALYLPFFLLLLRTAFLSLRRVGLIHKQYWLIFLLLVFFFPLEASQGSFLNHRFLIVVWLFLPLGLGEQDFKARKVFGICFITFLFCMLLTASAMYKSQRHFKEAEEVFKKLPKEKKLYSINFDTANAALNMHPLMHLWAAYPSAQIEFSPYLFAYSRLMPLSSKIAPSQTYFPSTSESLAQEILSGEICAKTNPKDFACETLKAKAFTEMLNAASFYDYCLLRKPPEAFTSKLKEDSWEKISESGSASLWANHKTQSFEPKLPPSSFYEK